MSNAAEQIEKELLDSRSPTCDCAGLEGICRAVAMYTASRRKNIVYARSMLNEHVDPNCGGQIPPKFPSASGCTPELICGHTKGASYLTFAALQIENQP